MRRLAPHILLLSCILSAPACKSKKRRAPLQPMAEQSSGALSSMIQVADPRADLQLRKGFYGVEGGAWRWTARTFTVTLRPPRNAAANGAALVVRLVLPAVLIQKLGPLHLSASVNGLALPAQEYANPGEYTYTREIPASAVQGAAVQVDFSLDKALPATPTDDRELGLIVKAIGFEARE